MRMQNAKTITDDWTVCGGFRLFYYGAGVEPSGIEYEIVNSKSLNGKCFDLSGRRITNVQLSKGIYIIGNRKVIIE